MGSPLLVALCAFPRRAPIRGFSRIAFLLLLLTSVVTCRGIDGAERTLPGSVDSLDELGRRVVEAFVQGDSTLLASLRLSETEHNELLWPELPASDASLNIPLEYVWKDIEARNRRALARTGLWLKDGAYRAQGVTCRRKVEELKTFLVHTDCWVALRVPGRGDAEVQLFKDVVERGGGYKVIRFYESRPTSSEVW